MELPWQVETETGGKRTAAPGESSRRTKRVPKKTQRSAPNRRGEIDVVFLAEMVVDRFIFFLGTEGSVAFMAGNEETASRSIYASNGTHQGDNVACIMHMQNC